MPAPWVLLLLGAEPVRLAAMPGMTELLSGLHSAVFLPPFLQRVLHLQESSRGVGRSILPWEHAVIFLPSLLPHAPAPGNFRSSFWGRVIFLKPSPYKEAKFSSKATETLVVKDRSAVSVLEATTVPSWDPYHAIAGLNRNGQELSSSPQRTLHVR